MAVMVGESPFEKTLSLTQEQKEDEAAAKKKQQPPRRFSHLLEEMKQAELSRSPSRYHEEVKVLLQINHSLSQVIHNIFIDFQKDYQRELREHRVREVASRSSFTSRFSLFQTPASKEED